MKIFNVKVGQGIRVVEISNISNNVGRYYNISDNEVDYLMLKYEQSTNKFEISFADARYFSEKDSILIKNISSVQFQSEIIGTEDCMECNEVYLLEFYKGLFRQKITKKYISKINW